MAERYCIDLFNSPAQSKEFFKERKKIEYGSDKGRNERFNENVAKREIEKEQNEKKLNY